MTVASETTRTAWPRRLGRQVRQVAGDGDPARAEVLGEDAVSASALGARVFVWGVWALMTLGAIAVVGLYARNVPRWDEYDAMVPVFTGHQPFTLSYLWELHKEHRIPASKLVNWVVYKLMRQDMRLTMYINALALSVASAALIRAAGRRRGWASYMDAVFPLVLLHWGHWENLVWALQFGFVLSTFLACVFLALVVNATGGTRLSGRRALAVSVCLLGLPLCGANGVAMVPALASWLVFAAGQWALSSQRRERKTAGWIALTALAPLVLAAAYFYQYRSCARTTTEPKAVLITAGQFVNLGLGAAASPYWPYPALAVAAVTAIVTGLLARAYWRCPESRCGIVGLLAFLAGMATLAIGFGWGRASLGFDQAFAYRYTTIATPLLLGLYFAWESYAPRAMRQLVPVCLFTTACILFLPNFSIGRDRCRLFQEKMDAVERDVKAGVPGFVIARRYWFWLDGDQGKLRSRFEMMRRAGWGSFRHLSKDQAMTRDEFKNAVMGKTAAELTQTVGNPTKTEDIVGSVAWVYENKTVDMVTGNLDEKAISLFRNGKVQSVSFAEGQLPH
jgi:hypothetical protein